MGESEQQEANQWDLIVSPIEATKSSALRAVCSDLGLSSEAFEAIEHEARDLRDFEAHEKPTLLTPRGRVKTLNQVADLSDALNAAIKGLWGYDSIDLSTRLPSEELPNGPPVYNLRGLRVGHIGSEAKRLAEAARDMVSEIGNAGVNGGRKQTLDYYALHVNNIWNAVSGTDMAIGRGGDFERLCSAVFEAAGVPSSPEGAIRHLIRNLSVPPPSPYASPDETDQ